MADGEFHKQTMLHESTVFMEGAKTVLGGPIEALGQWLDGLTDKVRNMEAKAAITLGGGGNAPSGRLVDAGRTEAPTVAQAKQIEAPEPKLEINKELASAVASVKIPEGIKNQQTVHVAASDVAEMAANTSKQTAMSTAMAQTQSQQLG